MSEFERQHFNEGDVVSFEYQGEKRFGVISKCSGYSAQHRCHAYKVAGIDGYLLDSDMNLVTGHTSNDTTPQQESEP